VFELIGVPAGRQRLIRKDAVMSSIAQRSSTTSYYEHSGQAATRPDYSGLNASATDSDTRPVCIACRLANLIEEHDDLDQAIASMLGASGFDDLVVSRLKKRRLHIKDEISQAQAYMQSLAGRM
jgi:hypothetical protein